MDHNDTKIRIVEAAIEVFLEKGYATATIRGICARAEANLAAVNYHFGSKDSLYAAALERITTSCDKRYPIAKGLDEASSPEERLRRFIRNLFRLLFPDDAEYARRIELLWRELGNPSPTRTLQVKRVLRPIRDTLESIIQEILGPSDAETVQLCIESIVGQQFFQAQNKFFIAQLYPGKKYLPRDVERLAEHVYRFSIAGLQAVRSISDKEIG